MSRFTEDVEVVNRLSGRVHEWELRVAVSYYLTEPGGETVHVPPAFKTDFASVPRPFWFWVAPWGRHGRAAILHDFLYQLGSVTCPGGTLRRPGKREADRIFLKAMAVLDQEILTKSTFWRRFPGPVMDARLALAVPRRWLIWLAVAVFGFSSYKRQQDKGSGPALEHQMLLDIAGSLEPVDGPHHPNLPPAPGE